MSVKQGRQWGDREYQIRTDHRRRYHWAGQELTGQLVLDLGCGIGYGSKIMAQRGCRVIGIDSYPPAIDHARAKFAHENVTYMALDLAGFTSLPQAQAAVAFEVLEHLENDTTLLRELRFSGVRVLLGSVPNEEVQPFIQRLDGQHYRHYTTEMLEHRLRAAGLPFVQFWYQAGKKGARSEITKEPGPTIVFAAKA